MAFGMVSGRQSLAEVIFTTMMLCNIIAAYRGLDGDSLTFLPQLPPLLRPALPQLQHAGHPGVPVTTDKGPGSPGTQPPSV